MLPFCPNATGPTVRVAAVAPGMSVPFCFHWYEKGAVPFNVRENVAVFPMGVIWFCGCEAMLGGNTTVSVAQLVTLLHAPVTSTQYVAASPAATEPKVIEGPFCPLIAVPFLRHT